MNLRVTVQAALALGALSLLAYGASDALNPLLGTGDSLLNRPWHLLALSLGASLLLGLAWPWLRGVRAGDRVVLLAWREHELLGAWTEGVAATALTAGRTGARIRVRLANGSMGEGIVQKYAGLLTPAVLRLTEAEVRAPRPGGSENLEL